MIGQRFGRLTIKSQFKSLKRWNCVCDCGSLVDSIKESKLRAGHTRSCGCLKKDWGKENLARISKMGAEKTRTLSIGMRFDRLVLTSVYPTSAICDCGITVENIHNASLRVGDLKSCGCLRKEVSRNNASKYARKQRLLAGKAPDIPMSEESKLERDRYKKQIAPLALARDDYTCLLCEVRGQSRMHTHHLACWRDNKNLRFDINNVVTLCRSCHIDKVHRGNVHAEPCPDLTARLRQRIECGSLHERDVNAAKNIAALGTQSLAVGAYE